ncbi:MAG: PD-(D/E)XK nuclease family protein, partial [Acidimicrobiia bacterium]
VVRERTVTVASELPELTRWFEERVEVVRARIAEPDAQMGADCGTCKFVAACPEHPTGAHFSSRKGDLLPGILTMTPTALDTWRRCAREWRSAYVLSVPSSDTDQGAAHGQKMHDVLRLVHEQGSCHDAAHIDDVLMAHGFDADERVRTELIRHARRCPEGATAIGHEITRARFHRKPFPPFMASARIDALWRHDGILDAHDYKTGQRWNERVADDSQARLQAWVLAPLAAALGLRVRIGFEHLAVEIVDDPEPFEPDDDDLAEIGEELRREVEAIRNEITFAGVSDAEVCGRCRYRSICPDSAVAGVANWPAVESDGDEV